MLELLPHAGFGPVAQSAPAGHARAAPHLLQQHLLWQHFPGDAAAEHEDDAGQAGSIRDAGPAALGLRPLRREKRFYDLPQLVGYKWFRHTHSYLQKPVLLGALRTDARTNRDGTPRPHLALDLANLEGDRIHAMFSGQVISTGTRHRTWGNWVMIRSTLPDGRRVDIVYAHLDHRGASGGTPSGSVAAGDVIGTADTSGNLQAAIDDGYAVQHLHVEVRQVSGSSEWNDRRDKAIDPEDILPTQFDSDGKVVPGTSC